MRARTELPPGGIGHAAGSTPVDRHIIVSLRGGLGNQLFQWAAGTAWRAAGHQVIADVVRCRGDRPLAIAALLTGWPRLARPAGLALAGLHKVGLVRPPMLAVIEERRTGFDKNLLERVRRGGYVLGYFQSPRYFAAVEGAVRAGVLALTRSMLTPSGRALADELAADEHSVAIHVRRGDYVSNPVAAAYHGTLGRQYYESALTMLDDLGHRRRLWCSDDPHWVANHLARPGDKVSHSALTTADGGEIALMASCRSRVIANSSFSWWAGWLGSPTSQTHPVIAPRRWFADPAATTSDPVPDTWLRM